MSARFHWPGRFQPESMGEGMIKVRGTIRFNTEDNTPETVSSEEDRRCDEAMKKVFPGYATASGIVSAALGHMQDRAAYYDSPDGERSMRKITEMFKALTGHHLSESEGYMFMCCLKLARATQGAFKADNYEDLAAYAGLAGEAGSQGPKEND